MACETRARELGRNFGDLIRTSTNSLGNCASTPFPKSVAISTSSELAQRLRSSSIAPWWAGFALMSTVKISRLLITICSISIIATENGAKLSKSEAAIPGLSAPVKRISPVNCSASALICVIRGQGYRESLHVQARLSGLFVNLATIFCIYGYHGFEPERCLSSQR